MTATRDAAAVRGASVGLHLATAGGGEAAGRLAQILTVAVAAQALGPEGLGVVGIAWSLTAVALALVQGGPELAGIRELGAGAAASHTQPRIIVTVTALKLALAVAALPVLLAVQWGLGHTGAAAVQQLAAQMAAAGLTAAGYAWALRGICRPGDQALVRVVQAVATLAIFWPLVSLWPDPLAVPAAEGGGAAIALLFGRQRLGRLARATPPSLTELRAMAGPALHLGLSGLVTTLAWMAPLLAAAHSAPMEEVGLLTGVLRLVLGCVGILQIAIQALFPLLTRALAQDSARGRDATVALTVQAVLATLAATALLVAAAPAVVPAVLGPGFGEAIALFRLLIPVLIPVALGSPASYALMARGKTPAVLWVAVAAALAMAAACAAAFAVSPTMTSATALHPVLWGQVAVTMVVAARYGVIGRPQAPWRTLFAPSRAGALLREGRGR
mgnify:CR=1 FL=1